MLIGFRSLISPRVCLFCGQGHEYLCKSCFSNNFLCPEISYLSNVPIVSMSRYQDLVREVIVRHKDHHFVAVRKYLTSSLVTALQILNIPKDCLIVSIPTAKWQIMKRLDDPIRFMVADAAAKLDLRFNHKILKLKAPKRDQVGLNLWQREKNVSEIFEVTRKIPKVVVCDDVITSGATLKSANKVLADAGIRVLANICVANTPRLEQNLI